MANDPDDQAAQTEETPAAAPAKPKGWVMPAVIAGAALLGILTARVAIAPRFTAQASDQHEEVSDEHGEGEAGAAGRLIELSNIVVNPAGSQGTRFVIASVAIEVTSAEAEETLKQREPQVRDLVTSVFESRDMEALTMTGARDSLKAALQVAVRELLKPKASVRVYLPQYVIQ